MNSKLLITIVELLAAMFKKIGFGWLAEFFKRISLKSPKWFKAVQLFGFAAMLLTGLPLAIGKIVTMQWLLIEVAGHNLYSWCLYLFPVSVTLFTFALTAVEQSVIGKLQDFINAPKKDVEPDKKDS